MKEFHIRTSQNHERTTRVLAVNFLMAVDKFLIGEKHDKKIEAHIDVVDENGDEWQYYWRPAVKELLMSRGKV